MALDRWLSLEAEAAAEQGRGALEEHRRRTRSLERYLERTALERLASPAALFAPGTFGRKCGDVSPDGRFTCEEPFGHQASRYESQRMHHAKDGHVAWGHPQFLMCFDLPIARRA